MQSRTEPFQEQQVWECLDLPKTSRVPGTRKRQRQKYKKCKVGRSSTVAMTLEQPTYTAIPLSFVSHEIQDPRILFLPCPLKAMPKILSPLVFVSTPSEAFFNLIPKNGSKLTFLVDGSSSFDFGRPFQGGSGSMTSILASSLLILGLLSPAVSSLFLPSSSSSSLSWFIVPFILDSLQMGMDGCVPKKNEGVVWQVTSCFEEISLALGCLSLSLKSQPLYICLVFSRLCRRILMTH